MTDLLPPAIARQVREMHEYRMGAHLVRVRLASGALVDDVLVSAGRVTRILGRESVPFDAADVVEVFNQTALRQPPLT